MTKVKIINNAGNIFARNFLKNCFGGDASVAYLASQKANWLKDHENQIGNLTEEFRSLKISTEDSYEFFESEDSDLFEVIE